MESPLSTSLNHSAAVLRAHAKSFFWASLFLPRGSRQVIARLYALCRYIDDVSDLQEPAHARAELLLLRAKIEAGSLPEVIEFERRGVQRRWFLDLLDGAMSDTEFSSPASERDLDLYCYRVAGVVGLMMCPLLGVTDVQAWQHAVDLGSAMQLTNIARDMSEDAAIGRVYVPQTWLAETGVTPTALNRRLLEKAEGLYRSGRLGLAAIPARTRGSIAVALEIYRDIGRSLRLQEYDTSRGRAYVKPARKIYLSCKALVLSYLMRKTSKRSTNEALQSNHSWLDLDHGNFDSAFRSFPSVGL